MWVKVSNGEDIRPADIDSTSSHRWVRLRRNIKRVEAQGDDKPAHYEWEEAKVRKEDWDFFAKILSHDEAFDDVYGALTELAEMIVEG